MISLIPEAYLKKGNARKLPINECLIPEGWQVLKKFPVVVSRMHVNGNVTVGIYLVDLFCTGVKDAFYMVNVPLDEYHNVVDQYREIDLNMQPCEYSLAHNIIYEALAYAEDLGIEPFKDFRYAEMILEVDNDDIPLMDIPSGHDGKPLLILNDEDPRDDYYLRQLDKYAGKDNYEVVSGEALLDAYQDDYENKNYSDLYWEEWDENNWLEFMLGADLRELTIYNDEIYHIYEKCIYEPAIAGKQKAASGNTINRDLNITYDSTGEDKYSQEEIYEQRLIYQSLNKTGNRRVKIENIISRIKQCLERWPDNPVFRNYLQTAYSVADQTEKAEEVAHETYRKFPDYLFGKLTYASILLKKNELVEFEAVFNKQFFLPGLASDRKEFHVSEYILFNTLMCSYFYKKNDFVSAFIYYKMILAIEFPDHIQLAQHIFAKLDKSILKEVRSLIHKFRKNEYSRQEILKLLTANSD